MPNNRNALQAEIDQNYAYFKTVLPRLIVSRKGEYALIRHQEIVEFFDDGYAAFLSGRDRFSDQLFSVQEIDDRIVDLGIFSRV
ncbi:MAG: hypothetical protein ACMVY4_04630 [Minwuia sp.]|uniref:hypothetical protein n=1 Tax=Minwuia sp. TaxID=2493630 RepID=UPI003A8B9D2B